MIVLTVVVSVVVGPVVVGLVVKSSLDGCNSSLNGSSLHAVAGEHLTKRPFDRYRGCYVDDPLAGADPWSGPTESGAATALASPATPPVLAK